MVAKSNAGAQCMWRASLFQVRPFGQRKWKWTRPVCGTLCTRARGHGVGSPCVYFENDCHFPTIANELSGTIRRYSCNLYKSNNMAHARAETAIFTILSRQRRHISQMSISFHLHPLSFSVLLFAEYKLPIYILFRRNHFRIRRLDRIRVRIRLSVHIFYMPSSNYRYTMANRQPRAVIDK